MSPHFFLVRGLRPGAESQRRWAPSGNLATTDVPALNAANAAKVPPDTGEAGDSARPTAPGDAGSRAVFAEQGVGTRAHREDPREGELAVEEKARVIRSSEGKRRECGGNDVRLFTGGQESEELEAFELEYAGAKDPLALALGDVEGDLEGGRGRGRRRAALGVPDRALG